MHKTCFLTPQIQSLTNVRRKTKSYQINSKNQGSILTTFYEQVLCAQIPKVQKDTDDWNDFGIYTHVKARHELVGEIDPRCQFNQSFGTKSKCADT